jgi:signal transduction histidine kinase
MNVVKKVDYIIECVIAVLKKPYIQGKIKFGTLVFGFALLLVCFFIPNNIIHAKPISCTENIDQSSALSIMIGCLFIVYLLFLVWFRVNKFTFERSLTMRLYGSKNKPLIKRFCGVHGARLAFFQKEPLAAGGKKEKPSQYANSENMAALGTLLAGVTHEINNPMTFINTSVHNLKQDLEKLKTFLFDLAGNEAANDILAAFDERFETLFKHLDTLNEGTTRIKEIVRNLESFSRMDNVEMKRVKLQEGLETTLNLVKAKYKDHVDFITAFKPGLDIQGNEGELKQVFMNIIINACQAIVEKQKKRGDKIKGTITIRTWKKNDHAVISFQDTGIGVSEKVRKKIFKPFFTTKPQGQGTGLGLSISYGIIKKHGGRIETASEQGKGTIITIYLPLMREAISLVRIKNETLH